MQIFGGLILGFFLYFFVRFILAGIYTIGPNERAVKTVFGKAQRLGNLTTLDDAIGEHLQGTERERYVYPQVRVIMPGGPYFKFPWEKIHKVSVATEISSLAHDPENPRANKNGTVLDAVTKDHLNTGLSGQIRYQVSERNLYAYLFGVVCPIAHVMGYFVSVLRERIATFEAQKVADPEDNPEIASVEGISINDLRKNLQNLNEHMDNECKCSEARYGIKLEASLITGIDPPPEVESALAAINTAHNQISSDISLASAAADQRIVESKRAVEIETLNAEAEVEPLLRLSNEIKTLKMISESAMNSYVRTEKLPLFSKAKRIIKEVAQ